MKKIIFLIPGILMYISTHGSPVDSTLAISAASNFYYHVSGIQPASVQKPAVVSVEPIIIDNTKGYYIVNFSDKAYVIISADNEYYPVIGFSDEANLSTADMPPAMKWWLEMQHEDTRKNPANTPYNNHIDETWQMLSEGNIPSSSAAKGDISPLLTCRWNQDSPYNFHCPEFSSGPGGRCYAGCVATAMSQIMYYHRYPDKGNGSNTYQHVFYGNITADFGSTTYDWNSMSNVINNNSKEAISLLMFHCGVAVGMNYSPLGSSANSEYAATAFVDFFKYSNRLDYKSKNEYDNADWNQMLIDNLEMSQPVYYSGYDPSAGGHAFVCDGVKDSCYFHFNWGWSGSGNGYFYISNLNSGNGNFSNYQSAIMNIAPYFYPYCQGEKVFNGKYKTFDDGSHFSYYWNDTDCEWLIAPDSADRISLTFSQFATQQDHDYLSIYDGQDANAPLIGHYSGHDLPPAIVSSGNKLFLRFTTDSTVQDLGWTAGYQAIASGIDNSRESEYVKTYPCPAVDVAFIELSDELSELNILLTDLSGKMIEIGYNYVNSKLIALNVSSLTSGFYLLRIKSRDKMFTAKLLIE